MRALTLSITLAAMLLVMSCGGSGNERSQGTEPSDSLVDQADSPSTSEVSQVEAQRRAWESLMLEDYKIRFEVRNHNGMGGSPGDGMFTMSVENGNVTRCHLEAGYANAEGPCDPERRDPVDLLFSRLRELDPEFTTVEFHPTFHFPTFIGFDDPATADEEFTIEVHEFDPVE